MRITLFHNASAGAGRHSGLDLERIARALGHDVEARALGAEGWTDLLDDPGDLVVVAGGDGSVKSVASLMVGQPTPIAVVPMGTANNVASALGVRGTPEALMAAWPSWESIGVDIGLADDGVRAQHFLECVGVGEFGRLMAHSDSLERSNREGDRVRKLERDVVHLRDRVAASKGQGVVLTIDGVDRSGEYLLAEVLNVWTIGPRLGLAPTAAVDDGRLHVVLVGPDHRAKLVRYLEALRGGDGGSPDLEVVSAARVALECDVDDLHVDGALWSGDSGLVQPGQRAALRLTVLRRAVHFLRPPIV